MKKLVIGVILVVVVVFSAVEIYAAQSTANSEEAQPATQTITISESASTNQKPENMAMLLLADTDGTLGLPKGNQIMLEVPVEVVEGLEPDFTPDDVKLVQENDGYYGYIGGNKYPARLVEGTITENGEEVEIVIDIEQ